LSITSRTLDDRLWTAAYVLDNGPVKYYLYDRTRKQATYLFSNRTDLDEYQLARMHPLTIKSRDGWNLVSYLTLPPDSTPDGDARPSNPVPLVLLVHGGPWGTRHLGLRSAASMAVKPRLRRPERQLPRLNRLRQGIHQRWQWRVGWQNARRPD